MTEKRKAGAEIKNKEGMRRLKVFKVSYGNKNLVDCMESIIRLHLEK